MTRTAHVTLRARAGVHGPKAVRFIGQTFKDLKARLAEVHFPGYDEGSFVEIKDGEGDFVCFLDDDELPAGDIHVQITKSPFGEYPFESLRVFQNFDFSGSILSRQLPTYAEFTSCPQTT